MPRLFGTDGVRGRANAELTPELAIGLGRAAAQTLVRGGAPLLIGRDPRRSGTMLEGALAAGACSAGAEVVLAGVVTTPALAHLVRRDGAGAGAMLSASHNPFEDNGIKFIARDGFKLPDEVEDALERSVTAGGGTARPEGAAVGAVRRDEGAVQRYLDYAVTLLPQGALAGVPVVVDGANGSASVIAPAVLARLGARVTSIHCTPDGVNINRGCGSTSPGDLARRVPAEGAVAGFAFDGDGDRLIAVDEGGRILDGDQIMAILALEFKGTGRLVGDSLAITVMSNLALTKLLQDAGIGVVSTRVGDRYVLDAMRAKGLMLGGEQSGHIISLAHNTTGDGLVTALLLLGAMLRTGKRLSELAVLEPYPQVLVNVTAARKGDLPRNQALLAAIARQEARLGAEGRVLVRPSGTEPLVRVMVEGAAEEVVREIAGELAAVIERELA